LQNRTVIEALQYEDASFLDGDDDGEDDEDKLVQVEMDSIGEADEDGKKTTNVFLSRATTSVHPYDLGIWSNIKEVLGERWYMPGSGPVGSGYDFRIGTRYTRWMEEQRRNESLRMRMRRRRNEGEEEGRGIGRGDSVVHVL
jgi:hypothetical protein